MLRGRLSVIGLLFALTAFGAGQKSAELKASELQKDVAILRQAYEELHPGLYRYNSKAEMDRSFASLATSLNHDQTLEDAYLAISVFTAKIHCGHTYPNFFNQNTDVAAKILLRPDRVPFYFRWINRQMVVTDDFTPEHQLPRGTVIRAINRVPVGEILEQLMRVARADGSNDAKRISYLEVRGDGLYEAFDIYSPLFFSYAAGKLELDVQRPSETVNKITVRSLTYEQRIAPIQKREAERKGGAAELFEWQYLDDGTALLRMPTWALYDSKWDWKQWLKAHVEEAIERRSPGFIIDLRGNEGGNDVGDEILPYLITRTLRKPANVRLVRYRQVPAELAPYLDTWDPSFKNWGEAARDFKGSIPNAPAVRYFELVRGNEVDGDVISPASKHFGGKVVVLTDASNSSATFQFEEVVQQKRLATLIGQPTGGNQRGINGGAFFFLRLPNSRIEVDLPLIATFPLTAAPDAGLTPDVVVIPTIPDIVAGRDADLKAARQFLQSN